MSHQNKNEWIFVCAVVLAALMLIVFRRAYTISVQYGYGFWSHETWNELKYYLLLGVVVLVVSVTIASLRSR